MCVSSDIWLCRDYKLIQVWSALSILLRKVPGGVSAMRFQMLQLNVDAGDGDDDGDGDDGGDEDAEGTNYIPHSLQSWERWPYYRC